MIVVSEISISPDTSIYNALSVIDSGSAQIALVVDHENRLLGTLTDGDIRRELLHGETVDSTVIRLMNRHFRYANSSDDKSSVYT